MASFSNGVNKPIIIFSLVILWVIPVHEANARTSLKVRPRKVNMGIIVASDYENGYKENIRANRLEATDTVHAWKVMVKTNDDNMGVIGGHTKSISDFYWRATGDYATQTTYTDITNYDLEAARGPKGNKKKVFIDFKILLAWAKDVPGNYKLTIVYTLTTQ